MNNRLTGICATTNTEVEVRFDQGITGIDSLIDSSGEGVYISPGFIDVQVNGFAGVDYNAPSTTVEDIGRSLDAMFATGVTRCLPTIITGGQESMEACLRTLARARATLPQGNAIEGYHIEGPHISPDDGPRGAHQRQYVRPPSIEEFLRLQAAADDYIRLVTVSPEWPEAPSFISELTGRGIVVSIGHTKATTDQIDAAIEAGARMSTHLGNGAHSTVPKFPNYIWDQLADDRLIASFIVDGIHLNANFLKVALRAKGIENSVLVTDAVMPAGCPPGQYRLGEIDVELNAEGRVAIVGTNRLAGSSLRMDRGISLLMQQQGLSLRDAVTMATRNPARAARIVSRQRGLTVGERADLVLFSVDETQEIRVLETYLSGRQVFRAA